MTYRTVIQSNYDEYLKDKYVHTPDALSALKQERELLLAKFPYSVLLLVSFPEMDYADRWCWQQFGPKHGVCDQAKSSDYPACELHEAHTHDGTWATDWLGKTDYNFGYNEWYFANKLSQELFLEFMPNINWGEKYPK
jgi:hypothetical protein